jgi:hypothetical protein
VGAALDRVAINETTDTIFVSWNDGTPAIHVAINAVTPLAIATVPATGIDDNMAFDPAVTSFS